MADLKISALPASTTPLAGTEVLPLVQSSSTKQVSVANLTAGRSVSFLSATSTNDITVNGIAVGKGASSVSTNTAIGVSALAANTSGSLNSAVGRTALVSNTTGAENTSVGGNSLQSNVDGSQNFAGGVYSLVLNVSGTANTGVGWGSLRSTTASYNTAVGNYAGYNLTTGSNCAFFGYNAQPSSATVSNEYTYGDANVTAHRFTNGNLVIGTSGNGIDFSATSGTGTSELLADYEEGTWTPTQGGGLVVVGAFSSSGTYTKVGRIVTVSGLLFGATSINTTAGGVMTGGLPFTGGSTATGTAVDSSITADVGTVLSGSAIYSSGAIGANTYIFFSSTYMT